MYVLYESESTRTSPPPRHARAMPIQQQQAFEIYRSTQSFFLYYIFAKNPFTDDAKDPHEIVELTRHNILVSAKTCTAFELFFMKTPDRHLGCFPLIES